MVKKLSLLLALASSALSSFGQVVPDGYYRFQSVSSERYIVVVDNRGSVNISTTDVDLGAIYTYRGFDTNIVSNPGSVIYMSYGSGGYDLKAQGASTYDLIGYYLKVIESRNTDGAYWAYATAHGMTKYLRDEDWGGDQGYVMTAGPEKMKDWYILPITTDGDNYFGIIPTCEVNGKYYRPFYASFPFSFASEGMKAYYVSQVGEGKALLKEYTEEVIPGGMPVIIECSTPDPTTNRLNLLTSSPSKVGDNVLNGTYFDLQNPAAHRNCVVNDPSTIRMLGVTSESRLGLVAVSTDDAAVVPANTSYLTVSAETASELTLVDEEEFNTSGIKDVLVDQTKPVKQGVYTITGVKIAEGNTMPENLPSGVYIVGGKKIVVK